MKCKQLIEIVRAHLKETLSNSNNRDVFSYLERPIRKSMFTRFQERQIRLGGEDDQSFVLVMDEFLATIT
jgi:hypothetical protein